MQKLRGEISADQAANAAAEHQHEEFECKKSSNKYDNMNAKEESFMLPQKVYVKL